MWRSKIDEDGEIKDLNRLTALINKLKSYDTMTPDIAKEKFEQFIYYETEKPYIIVGRDVFSYRSDKHNSYYKDKNSTNFCYGCSSLIINGKCHGCNCKQKLKLSNNMGAPSGKHYVSNFYVYKRHGVYRRKLVITQILPDEFIVKEFRLEQKIPYRLKIWFNNWDYHYVAILTILQINILPIEIRNHINKYLYLIILS